eukprot:7381749-Prymnesium_polylepis.2
MGNGEGQESLEAVDVGRQRVAKRDHLAFVGPIRGARVEAGPGETVRLQHEVQVHRRTARVRLERDHVGAVGIDRHLVRNHVELRDKISRKERIHRRLCSPDCGLLRVNFLRLAERFLERWAQEVGTPFSTALQRLRLVRVVTLPAAVSAPQVGGNGLEHFLPRLAEQPQLARREVRRLEVG